MSTAEIWELMTLLESSTDSQFEFWIATTFALLIAGFTAGAKLGRKLQLGLSALYLACAGILQIRIGVTAMNMGILLQELNTRDLDLFTYGIAGWGRGIVILIGTLAAIWYFNIGAKQNIEEGQN